MVAEQKRPKKTCFFVAPIGVAKSEVRDRSDKILRFLVRPIVEEFGYEVQRADEIADPGQITSQIIRRIVSDDLVVADLTGGNPNVFYELAVRHACQKPFIQLIDSKEKIPFDIANTRTIHVDHTDLISVEEAKEDIRKQISRIESSTGAFENPLTHFLKLNPAPETDITLNAVYDRISEVESAIQAQVEDLYTEVSFPDPVFIEGPKIDRDIKEIYDVLYDIKYQIALLKK